MEATMYTSKHTLILVGFICLCVIAIVSLSSNEESVTSGFVAVAYAQEGTEHPFPKSWGALIQVLALPGSGHLEFVFVASDGTIRLVSDTYYSLSLESEDYVTTFKRK